MMAVMLVCLHFPQLKDIFKQQCWPGKDINDGSYACLPALSSAEGHLETAVWAWKGHQWWQLCLSACTFLSRRTFWNSSVGLEGTSMMAVMLVCLLFPQQKDILKQQCRPGRDINDGSYACLPVFVFLFCLLTIQTEVKFSEYFNKDRLVYWDSIQG